MTEHLWNPDTLSRLAYWATILSIVGVLATAIGTGVALWALKFARGQIETARAVQRATYMSDLYREYLRLAFENPKLANPDLGVVTFDYEAGTIDGDRIQFERYEWFVSYLVDFLEQVLASDEIESWRTMLETHIDFHRRYFASTRLADLDYLAQSQQSVRAFIGDVLAKSAANPGAAAAHSENKV